MSPNRGFTLLEAMISLALVSLILSGSLFILGRFNDHARSNRLTTCAQALALSRIDLLLNGQFRPQSGEVHPALALGVATQAGVPLYTDPVTGQVGARADVTTTVTDAGKTLDGASLRLRRARVVVSYSFRNRPRQVVLETMRASDL